MYNWSSQLLGIGIIAPWLPGGRTGIFGSLSIIVMGWLLEMGRNAYSWVSERWRFRYSLTTEFHEGDPVYDWITAFLAKEQLWKGSSSFMTNAKSSWPKGNDGKSLIISEGHTSDNAEHTPTYGKLQVFKWNGYWFEFTKNVTGSRYDSQMYQRIKESTIYLRVYTKDVSAISDLVEHSRKIYMEVGQPFITIYGCDKSYHTSWNIHKRKFRRSMDSIVLPDGVLDSLIADAQEFLSTEDWYRTAGIPYRRGYLLYGPPGTGKTSTIYALAGDLGLDIYTLSLASSSIDDAELRSAVGTIPRPSIFLLEDIDCIFPRYENGQVSTKAQSRVTLSGLLNVLDGVASQEGGFFFATSNHIEDLDNALIRPGRIDKRIRFYHSTKLQTVALYKRFFPPAHCAPESAKEGISDEDKASLLNSLATEFGEQFPEGIFTVAELQGFLLTCKFKPEKAVKEVSGWAHEMVKDKIELEERRKARQEGVQRARDANEAENLRLALNKMETSMELEGGKEVQSNTGESSAKNAPILCPPPSPISELQPSIST